MYLTLSIHSSHAVVTFNRPDKLNALTSEMFESFDQYLDQLDRDEKLRVLIITASGDRAFCAGTDIAELQNSTDGRMISSRGQALCDRIENFPVPVIAAINGIAAGGGMELALACHLRIASTNASFSLPETKLGLIPGYGGSQRLARELGVGQALEMMLTGRALSTDEALQFGLINKVVDPDTLMETAVSLAEDLAKLSSLSVRTSLKSVTRGLNLSLEDGLKLETELFASLFETEDAREGIRAFLEKREPSFKGR